ncbi:MAG: LysR family transcriptional regulator [Coriobacteriales bacterium]|nr:LysR family transcriptional regulator [Coriobacteriales bacterium]
MDDNARAFVAIVDSGSITAAARKLYLSQPALSQRLKQIEEQLGCQLIDRSGKPLQLTQAGQIYYEWARRTLDDAERMERDINAVSNSSVRRLMVGTSFSRSSSILPDIIERFEREVNGCVLFFLEAGMPDSHNHLLSTGGIDLAIFTPVKAEATLFTSEPICSERMMLVAPRSFEIPAIAGTGSAYPQVKPDVIQRQPFIMPPSNLKHAWLVKSMMDAANVRLHIALHSCNNETTLELIKRGLGISLLPSTFLQGRDCSDLAIYSIEGFNQQGTLYYNRPLNRPISNDELRFVRMAKDWVAAHPQLMPQ